MTLVRATLLCLTWLATTPPVLAQPASPHGDGAWDFRCPPAGAVVERSNGAARLVFQGHNTAAPFVCRAGAGGTTSLVLSVWRQEQPSIQAGLEPLKRLFPARPGAVVRVHYFRETAEVPQSGFYEDVWRVLGPARIEVPAGRFNAIGFERETQSLGSTSRRFRRRVRFWLDAITGVPLKLEHLPLGGRVDPELQSWEATRVRIPERR